MDHCEGGTSPNCAPSMPVTCNTWLQWQGMWIAVQRAGVVDQCSDLLPLLDALCNSLMLGTMIGTSPTASAHMAPRQLYLARCLYVPYPAFANKSSCQSGATELVSVLMHGMGTKLWLLPSRRGMHCEGSQVLP
jgi:hypothetical protein